MTIRPIKVTLDLVALELLDRECRRTGKSRAHVVRRLIYQSYALRKTAKQVPRMRSVRGKNRRVIKNLGVTKQEFAEIAEIGRKKQPKALNMNNFDVKKIGLKRQGDETT